MLKKFMCWYQDWPLARKLAFLFSSLIVVIILTLTSVIRPILEHAMLEATTEAYDQKFDMISNSSMKLFDSAKQMTTALLTNEDMQTWFGQSGDFEQESDANYAEHLREKIQAEKQLDYLDSIWGDNQFSSISAFNRSGETVNTNNIRVKSTFYQQLYQQLLPSDEERWIDLYTLSNAVGSLSGIAYIRPYRDNKTGRIQGHVLVEYQNDFLKKNFAPLRYGKDGDYIVADRDGWVKLTSNDKFVGRNIGNKDFFQWVLGQRTENRTFMVDGERYLVTAADIHTLNWVMIVIVPVRILTEKGDAIIRSVYLIGLAAILVAAALSFFMSHNTTRQLAELTEVMKQFGDGQLKISVPVKSNDEVGMLSQAFNNMAGQIRQLVDQVYREQRDKRKFEFSALQAQIHPHFLYNSLNSVSSLIQMNRPKQAFSMIHAIGTFYRTALSNGNTVIPIADEITNIKSYIEIQTIRYREKIQYDICLDEAIMQEQIVKFTLQPLVENAIYHGVKLIDSTGLIRIYDRMEENRIVICVQDNGAGMDVKILEGLLSDNAFFEKTSFGLNNIHQRLKLYFGPQYGLEIKSEHGNGTTVSVLIPYSHGKGETHED